jgi:tetratricopeptide (TPR) repeat protein
VPEPPSSRSPDGSRDLDAIVLKALAKDPASRYGAVAELSADIARLRGGRPVMARVPSALDRAVKLVRRNKGRSLAVAAVLIAAVAAASIYVRQARIEQRRFEDARQLVHTVIFDLQPKMEAIPATLPLRQTLIQETMRYLESVSRDAGRNVPLLLELSNAYQQLARVQGDITVSTLGNAAEASRRYARADELMQRALALAPDDPAVLKDAALLYGRLANFDNGQARDDDSRRHAQLAVRYAEHNAAVRDNEFDAREILAFSVFYSAQTAPAENFQQRVDTFERAGTLYRALAAEKPEKENLTRNGGIIGRFLASAYHDKSDETKALDHGKRALATSELLLSRHAGDTGLQLEVATDAMVLGRSSMARDSSRKANGRTTARSSLPKACCPEPAPTRAPVSSSAKPRGIWRGIGCAPATS